MPAPIVLPPRVARLEEQHDDEHPRSTLVVRRIMPLGRYSVYGVLTKLTINIDTLLYDFSHPIRAEALRTAAASVCSLTITHSPTQSSLLSESALDEIFRFIKSLCKLDYLAFENFVLDGHRDTRPTVPACVADSPLVVGTFTIINSHASSLMFLLKCVIARRMVFDSCSFSPCSFDAMLSP
ncbi:hypothetical protein NMY22_g9031 [Coprinellus aureogranulatus]|nr:hypothetical protein NMY22_g9031 [Coprinellus aureogranulatus]